MAKENNDWIKELLLYGAIGYGIYYVLNNGLKNILPSLGVDPNAAANQATVTAQVAVSAPANAFSPQFAPWVQFYSNNAPEDANGNPVSMQTFFQNIGTYGLNSDGTSIWGMLDVAALTNLANQLNTDINAWYNIISNENGIEADVNQITTQIQMAFVASYFLYVFNIDLLSNLQGSLFKKGLSPSDLAALITRVNNLPVS